VVRVKARVMSAARPREEEEDCECGHDVCLTLGSKLGRSGCDPQTVMLVRVGFEETL